MGNGHSLAGGYFIRGVYHQPGVTLALMRGGEGQVTDTNLQARDGGNEGGK